MNLNEKISLGKNNLIHKSNILFFLSIIFFFTIDRLSKFKIVNDINETYFYINDFLNINLIWNTGIGFGLFSFQDNFFYNIITLLISFLILVLFYVALKSDKYDKFFLSIILGGALGNFFDRIFYKAVPDFIDLHYKDLHWFTFNVADICITLGIISFLIKGFLVKK